MVSAPPLPVISPNLRSLAERIQILTEEMLAGKTADDWGRVTSAETERRPLIHQLVDGGFREEGGEDADQWLRWLLETDRQIMERGDEVLAEMRGEGARRANGERAARAYRANND
jgi:hypothetical protein